MARIVAIHASGLRTIEHLDLPLGPLTVLIGENGAGKSTIVELTHMLRAAARPEFVTALHTIHGGMLALLRVGATSLTVGATVAVEQNQLLKYEVVILNENGGAVIHGESLRDSDGASIFERDRNEIRFKDQVIRRYLGGDTLLGVLGILEGDPRISQTKALLEEVETHVGFETMPVWAARARNRPLSGRSSIPIQRTTRLNLLGDNLPNVYYALKSDARNWQDTLELIRLGLGDDVEAIRIDIDPAGGAIGLVVEVRGLGAIPISGLSDGQLSYLAFVGLYRLSPQRSLVAFDEPELHLHPALVARITQFFEDMSVQTPVLLATHSDSLLDSLSQPEDAVRVCELLQANRSTSVRKLDANALATWLRTYRGVGHVRSDGFLPQVIQD